MTEWIVRRATYADADAVAQVMADAFADYAWTRWTVSADRHGQRIGALQRLVATEVVLPHGELWIAEDAATAELAAAAAWLRPDSVVPQYVWRDVADQSALLCGDRWQANDDAEARAAGLRPDRAHWYLGGVGVRRARQRSGLGRAVLRPVLERAAGELAYLETSSEANVGFYRALGFEVSGHLVIPGGGPPVWAMTREPDRPAPASPQSI